MNVVVRQETHQDREAIRKVNRLAFGGEDEANLVDALRQGGFIATSLVAELDGSIVGHILFSRIEIGTTDGMVSALSLAPMAVLPSHQQKGIGIKLVDAGLKCCRDSGHTIVVVLGHPDFYPKFGFSAKLASPLKSPFGGGAAWMALELVPDALASVVGTVEYSRPFMMLEE